MSSKLFKKAEKQTPKLHQGIPLFYFTFCSNGKNKKEIIKEYTRYKNSVRVSLYKKESMVELKKFSFRIVTGNMVSDYHIK